jgi:3-methyladenine DNA glycosylase AlkC
MARRSGADKESSRKQGDRPVPRRMSEISPASRRAMSQGGLPTRNLVEWLSVDRAVLLRSVWGQIDPGGSIPGAKEISQQIGGGSALQQSWRVAEYVGDRWIAGSAPWQRMVNHSSDIVREWAALLVGLHPAAGFKKRLEWIGPLAQDHHPGVREIAWIALRQEVIDQLSLAIQQLTKWTRAADPRLRRYASEITRPRGVWAAHVAALKEDPSPGLLLLEPLRSDEDRYVANSVANWLNDASKSKPDWVLEVSQRWERESPTAATQYIVRRALRTVRKNRSEKG